jgi:hypothetical protein
LSFTGGGETLELLGITGLSRFATGGAVLLLAGCAALLLDEDVSSGEEHAVINIITRRGRTQSFLRLFFITK